MDATIIPLIARFLIGFLYVFAGVSNIYYRHRLIDQMTKRKIPFAKQVFWVGIIAQIIAGLDVIFNIFILPAILLLIVFTVLATFMFHNFWDIKDDEPFRLNTLKFVTNFSLVGALMLVGYIFG